MDDHSREWNWPGWSWQYALVVAAVLAFALGLWGFLQVPFCGEPPKRSPPQVPAALLKALQLFVYAVPADEICSTPGWLAAFLAPLATAGALLAALGVRTRRAMQRLRLWARPAHDVFLGGGQTAAGLAISRKRAAVDGKGGAALVGLDLDGASPLARVMEGFGGACFTRIGDALSWRALAPLQLHRTRNVWVTTGSDERNLEVARRVCTLLRRAAPRDDKPVRLLVNVFARDLVRTKDALFQGLAPDVVIEFFCMPRLAARTLVREHPPLPAAGQPAPHVLIIGSGDLAAALAVHVAQHCVYQEDPAACVRITLAGRGVQALHDALLRQFPALAPGSEDAMLDPLLPLARFRTLECDEANLPFLDWQRLQDEQVFNAVYVATEGDLPAMGAALRAAALRELTAGVDAARQPIVACLQQTGGSLCALSPSQLAPHFVGGSDAAPATGAPLVHLFDVYGRCIRPHESYPGERQDHRAMLVRAVYNRADAPFKADAQGVERALRDWQRDHQEDFRWSNRLAADHIDVKLDLLAQRAERLGASADTTATLRRWRHLENEPPGVLDAAVEAALQSGEALQHLARIEHRRFVVERLLEGWLPLPPDRLRRNAGEAPDDLQKKRLRLNHTLVRFERLAEVDRVTDQRAKDLAIVRAIPEILRGERLAHPPAAQG